jgi:hypothetical protein
VGVASFRILVVVLAAGLWVVSAIDLGLPRVVAALVGAAPIISDVMS